MSDFILFAKTIQTTVNNLNSLFVAGYPKDHNFFNEEFFICDQGQFNTLKKFETETSNRLKTWVQSMTESYNNCYFMTFLTGENIWVLKDYLEGNELDPAKKTKAENLLHLMGKQKEAPGLLDMMIDVAGVNQDPKERLARI